MTNEQMISCNVIIHTASTLAAAVGTGMAQVPGSDSAIITPIQLGMAISLGQVFGIDLSKSTDKATLASASAAMAGRTISQALVGWIPGLGNVINASTAAALTEVVGWNMAKHFENQSA